MPDPRMQILTIAPPQKKVEAEGRLEKCLPCPPFFSFFFFDLTNGEVLQVCHFTILCLENIQRLRVVYG